MSLGSWEITLLRPLWLLALPGLAALWLWLARRQGGLGDWERVMDPALLAGLRAMGRVDPGTQRLASRATVLAAGLVVLALSGPALERRDAVAFRNLDGAVFVVDASPSVTESPRWPQLLTMGRFAVAALGSRPAALVVFAGDAYVAADMTHDTRQLGQTLSLIAPGTVPDPGTRPERGLGMAAGILEQGEVLAGDVILMTDGGGLGSEALSEAGRIAGLGARLSVVSLGPPGDALDALARSGGGTVFTLDQTDEIAAWIGAGARERLERQDYPLLFWADYGRWLLALALLPVLSLFRRRAA